MHVVYRFLVLGIVLGSHLTLAEPATAQAARTDATGDPLPQGALARMGTTRLRHGGPVGAARFAADGATLISFGGDNTFRTWDVRTGKELRSQVRHGPKPDWCSASAFSPDGKRLALAAGSRDISENRTVILCDPATGKDLAALIAEDAGWSICSVAFSPDGKLLAAGDSQGQIHLWDVATKTTMRRMGSRGERVTAVAFSPDGKILAAGNGVDGLCLWDVASGKEIRNIQERGPGFVGKNSFQASLVFAPDGKTLASGNSDAAVRLWDIPTGKEIRHFQGHQSRTDRWGECFNSLMFLPDGKSLITDNDNGMIELWETATGNKRTEIRAHRVRNSWGPGPAMTISPDEKTLASWGWENAIRLWDLTTGKELLPLAGHRNRVLCVAIAPDGKTLVSSGGDCRLAVWDSASGKATGEHQVHHYWDPDHVAFSPDGKTVAVAGLWDEVPLWDVVKGRELWPFQHKEKYASDQIKQVSFLPDGRLLASTRSSSVWLSTLPGREGSHVLGSNRLRSVELTTDGQLLAMAGGHYVLVDDPAGMLPTEDDDARETLPAGKKRPMPGDELDWLGPKSFSRDGRTVAILSHPDQTITVREVLTGQVRAKLSGENCVRYSPDGRLLAAGSTTGEVRLWNVATLRELPPLQGHRGDITWLAFSPDGAKLASASADTTILLWDLSRLDLPRRPRRNELATEQLDCYWSDLGSEDAARAFQAIQSLIEAPASAVALLTDRVRPVNVDAVEVARWVSDLDHELFAVRDRAAAALRNLGKPAESALRAGLTRKPSLEVRQRLEELLESIDAPVPPLEIVQGMRAIEVLEAISDAGSTTLLNRLADGDKNARLTHEAKSALTRRSTR